MYFALIAKKNIFSVLVLLDMLLDLTVFEKTSATNVKMCRKTALRKDGILTVAGSRL